MNTVSTALFCLISIPLFAADVPKPSPAPFLPELSAEIIAKTASYATYITATGTPAQSWKDTNPILFYKKDKPYYEFTNFYSAPITMQDVTWPTVEHYYQAMKFADKTLQERIRNVKTAREAFNLGNHNKDRVRADWQQISLAILAHAIHAKFSQHASLAVSLLNTETRVLVEDAGNNDAFFGAGADYKGRNYLGRILMLIRTMLAQESNV